MEKGDTFTHNGNSYTVDRVFPNGKVLAKTEANIAPNVLVIHPDNIV